VLAQPVTASDLYDTLARFLAPEDEADPQSATRGPAAKAQPDLAAVAAGFVAPRALEVLLAEDNPVNQKLACTLLERAGHRVTRANDGIAAVDAWRAGHFDVVLMDVQMPRLGGFEATARIRSLELERQAEAGDTHVRRTPIIALTAHAMIGDEERCLNAGMDAYLSKPLRRERLAAVLEQVTAAPGDEDPSTRARPARAGSLAKAVDTDALLDTVGGDQDLLMHLCSMFLESLPGMQDRLRLAIEAGDAREVVAAAHALRGVISNFHARPSVDALSTLERTAAEGHLDALVAGHEHAHSEVERAAAALRETIGAMA
jgi:CheY-like chemotaxis protein/HPt (histidine-containing phosphotransfer) domain-containing protein